MINNSKTNAYLKEIADICGIEKNLTFHRHSTLLQQLLHLAMAYLWKPLAICWGILELQPLRYMRKCWKIK